MAGSITVGGNKIFEHTGATGSGVVQMLDQNGNPILTDTGTSVTIDNVGFGNSTSFPLSGRNLIINGDFRVNQRGAASRTETPNAYNYDRWYYDGTYLYQGVEDLSVANGTYTLSWTDAGSDITAAYIVSTDSSNNNGPDSGLTYTSVSNGGNITVSEGTEYSKHLWIRFGGTLANLSKVQLVYGSVATPFELRSYGEELALCQRYYFKSDGNVLQGAQAITSYCNWFFPTVMRATPTFTAGTSPQYSGVTLLIDRVYFYYNGSYAFLGTGASVDAEL